MTTTKAMLCRIRRLQKARIGHVAQTVGLMEEFEAETKAGIKTGRYDPNDMPIVLIAVKQWIERGL